MNIPVTQSTLKMALESSGDQIILGGKDRRIFILILVFWSLCVAMIGMFSILLVTGHGGWEHLSVPALMLAGMTAWCYLLGGWSSRLTLDISSRTYLHEYGLYPFIIKRQGSLDAFDHVSLARQQRTNGGGGTYYVSLLVLEWKKDTPSPAPTATPGSAGRPITLWISPRLTENPGETWKLATRLAQVLSLPLQNDAMPRTP